MNCPCVNHTPPFDEMSQAICTRPEGKFAIGVTPLWRDVCRAMCTEGHQVQLHFDDNHKARLVMMSKDCRVLFHVQLLTGTVTVPGVTELDLDTLMQCCP